MFAMGVIACYEKSMVLMESQWLLWKVNGCYEIHLLPFEVTVAMEVNGNCWSLIAMVVYGCYGNSVLGKEVNGC
jgi:hypothetical protein